MTSAVTACGEKLPDSGIGAGDTQFLHPVAQGVGVEAEDLGGPARAVNNSVGLPENGEDVVADFLMCKLI